MAQTVRSIGDELAWPLDEVAATRQSGSRSVPNAACRNAFRSLDWAISELRDQGMPHEEIAGILGGSDPKLAHRYLELHRERLAERLMDQRRIVGRIETLVTEAIRLKTRIPPDVEEDVRSAGALSDGIEPGTRGGMMARDRASVFDGKLRAVEPGHVLRVPARRVVNMESAQGGPR